MINVLNKEEVHGIEKYHLLNTILENCSDADSKIYYSKMAIELAEKLDENLASPLIFLGTAYLDKGDLSNALETFFELAGFYKDDKDMIGLAIAFDYIAETYSSQDNLENAIGYLKKAINILEGENDSIKLASTKHNLGYLYYKAEMYDSALLLYDQSEIVYKKANFERGLAYCIGNKGVVYSRLKNFEKAQEKLLMAIRILQKHNDEYAIADFLLEYARILFFNNELNKALVEAKKSYDLAHTNNIIAYKRDVAKLLSDIYVKKLQYDSAFLYQTEFILLNDSIKNIETVQQLANKQTEFEVAQKQTEVDFYKKKWVVQLFIMGSLVIILLLSVALIYVYYSNLKRVRKFSKILEERKKVLEKQSVELKELNRVKDKFFSIISHDLRSPISSIGGISVLIKESLESDNKALLNEIIDYIDQTVLSMSGLLENLLNWAQSQQGQFPYHEETLNLRTILVEVIKLFSTISVSKSIKIKHKISEELMVKADRNSMMTIFRNLISNALKYTEMGGEINVNGELRENKEAVIEISDTGIGIPADKILHIFELKEDKSTWGTDREKGFGLGLNLVGEFVKLNKGEINVKSVLGKGTTFTLTFPVIS